jgi:Immunity protein Imm1
MSFLDEARKTMAEIREHSQNPEATKRIWGFTHPNEVVHDDVWGDVAPVLRIGAGCGVGVLSWAGEQESYTAIGGLNSESASYEWSEWDDAIFPPGTELPIGTVLNVLDQFIASSGRPDLVQWAPITLEHVVARTG